jgi:DNA polymerase III subunit beta
MNLLKAPRDEFLKVLQLVTGIVERRHTLPILANVLLKKQGREIGLTSSDLEIQIRTQAEFDGDAGQVSTTIAARKLLDILRSVPENQPVSLTLNGSKLTVQSGKSRFALQTLPAEDFPLVSEAVEFSHEIQLPQATLKRLIGQVHFAMAVHDIRYYLNGILMVVEGTQLTLVATDGHRLAVAQATLPNEVSKQEVILPRKSVLELQRLLGEEEGAMVSLKFAANQAKISLPGIEFVSKLVEGKFPDYQRVIPKGYAFGVEIDRAALLTSLQRASILTNDKFRGVRVNFEPGVMRINSTNAEQEEAFEELDVNYAGDSIEIGFNVSYLVDALANMQSETVHIGLQDGNSSALFTVPGDASFRYVVMPMRI